MECGVWWGVCTPQTEAAAVTVGKGLRRWHRWVQSRAEREPRVGSWSQMGYLVSPVSCVVLGQPLTTPSLSLLICVMGVVIPAPQDSGVKKIKKIKGARKQKRLWG